MHPRLITFPAFDVFGAHVEPVLHSYGVLLAIAFVAGLWVASWQAKRSGLDAALIHESIVRARKLGITGAECSWMLEDNEAMLASIRQTGAREYRRYRLYEKAL